MSSSLVILGSTTTALAVARHARAHGLTPIVVDTEDGVANRSRWVTVKRAQASNGSDAVMDVLRECAGTSSWLIATGDHWLRWMMSRRAWLDANYAAVLHPPNSTLEICLDKLRFAAWCEANGLSCPRSWFVNSGPRPTDLRPPYLIRPAQTLHGRAERLELPKAVEAKDDIELQSWLDRFAAVRCDAVVSQSLLGQPLIQYSVPFARGYGRRLSFVARKVRPAPDQCAVGTYVELSPAREVEELSLRAAEALDFFGVGEAEVLHSDADGKSYLIEINARPWLQYGLAPASGHDFLGLLLQRPLAERPPHKTGRRWLDFRSDLYATFSSSVGVVRSGQLPLRTYLKSIVRANVFAHFDLRDPAPALWRRAVSPARSRGAANG
jgi:predicted ATP-grasp superfamily ATP-dependent carboligase